MKPILIYRSGIHLGEELLVQGNHNSGMVTFSGCHLACRFCYTPETSRDKIGEPYTGETFTQLVDELVARGARNLNLISPTHLWGHLSKPLAKIKIRYGKLLPLILKISGYEKRATLESMAPLTDVFVPDFKVWSSSLASDVALPPDYGQTAQQAIKQLMQTHGESHFTEGGKLSHGMIVRHLMMPDHFEDSLEVVRAIGETGYQGHLNLMTYFIDPLKRQVTNANPAHVSLLATRALEIGCRVLVNGKAYRTSPRRGETPCEVTSYAG